MKLPLNPVFLQWANFSFVMLFWYPVGYISSYLKFELDKNYLEGPEMEYQRGAHNNNEEFQW